MLKAIGILVNLAGWNSVLEDRGYLQFILFLVSSRSVYLLHM